MWPDLEAILVVPNNAHALFARPMVTSPRSRIALEIDKGGRSAVVLCDGRRQLQVPPGARIEIVRSPRPLKWLRIDSEPFADRLVTKFKLPVTGWRGGNDAGWRGGNDAGWRGGNDAAWRGRQG